jgi:hypothetical protein
MSLRQASLLDRRNVVLYRSHFILMTPVGSSQQSLRLGLTNIASSAIPEFRQGWIHSHTQVSENEETGSTCFPKFSAAPPICGALVEKACRRNIALSEQRVASRHDFRCRKM